MVFFLKLICLNRGKAQFYTLIAFRIKIQYRAIIFPLSCKISNT